MKIKNCFSIVCLILLFGTAQAQFKMHTDEHTVLLKEYLFNLDIEPEQFEYYIIIPNELSGRLKNSLWNFGLKRIENRELNDKVKVIICAKDVHAVRYRLKNLGWNNESIIYIDGENIYSRLPIYNQQTTIYRYKDGEVSIWFQNHELESFAPEFMRLVYKKN
jgi:hypothetical protein